ncbi:MAG: response regulator, partial [Bacteroidetes bacterium]|nr:response regulator [Bacteroidota bacterium]
MDKLNGRILIVDDDLDVLYTARLVLKRHFTHVESESSPKNLINLLSSTSFDVIILDMNFSPGVTNGQEGLFWLRKILKHDPQAHVMMNTAYGDVEIAVEAMKQGAIDFLIKPWKKEKLIASVKAILKLSQTSKEVARLKSSRKAINQEIDRHFPEMISESEAMKPIFSSIQKVAITDANVLILG